jgi:glucose/arabinose dehydrogenase
MKIIVIILLFLFILPLSPLFAQNEPRKVDAKDIQVPQGYKIEPFAIGLSVATSAIFDGEDLLVAESGFAGTAAPRVLRIKPDGTTTMLIEKGLEAPVTGLLKADNSLYISHKGKVSILENGNLRDIVTGLPSSGDHQNNEMALGQDGKIYIGQGTVTNSAVVGLDNYYFGWLEKSPQAHDVPCKDVTLNGVNFETENPLKNGEKTVTGAYLPYGTPSTEGQVIRGNPKCSGAIIRFDKDGTNVEAFAWGLRNPFGLAVDSKGQLWSTFHGADTRGSREIANDPDYLVKVEKDAWYGWPDYFDGQPVTSSQFDPAEADQPTFLLQEHPPLTQAFTTFDPHAGVNGIAFAPQEFGFADDAFVAMYGTFTPVTAGFDVTPSGFRIARVDIQTGDVTDFATNVIPGPSYIAQHKGFNRPSDVVFGPDNAMYVVDFGAGTVDEEGLKFVPHTGTIWRIYPEALSAKRPNGPIEVPLSPASDQEREPFVKLNSALIKELSPQLLFGLLFLLVATLLIISLFKSRSRKKPRKNNR